MERVTASLLFVVLVIGQSLSLACLGPEVRAEAGHGSSVAVHEGHGRAPSSVADSESRAHDADHGSGHASHDRDEGRCGALMVCGIVAAVPSLGPTAFGGLDTEGFASVEPSSLLEGGHPPQEPPPPRFG